MQPLRLIEKLFHQFDKKHLADDPVCFVHRYKEPADQEIVGLISALFAFGNVKSIQNSIAKILEALGEKPYDAISNFNPKKYLFDHWGHRWIRADDLKELLVVLKKILRQYGSIKNLFLKGYKSSDPDISNALIAFSETMKEKTHAFLFPSPSGGSPCKRANMFLRWMVRPADGIDLGLWPEIPTSKLIVPLDTHITQFARRFKISRYKNPSWKMAMEMTRFLKTLDANDPVKFDFAICHYGMIHGWDGFKGTNLLAQKISKTSR